VPQPFSGRRRERPPRMSCTAVGAQKFKLDHLKAGGTLLLLSGIITMAIYRVSPRRALRLYGDTLVQLRWTVVTVTAVLGLSFVMNLSGQTATLGLALASAGGVFAAISPLLGWIGVALTGSDTSSNRCSASCRSPRPSIPAYPRS